MRKTKIHIGKNTREEQLPICNECQKDAEEVWECNRCGKLFCADHIINDGNDTDDIKYICVNCQNKRMGG